MTEPAGRARTCYACGDQRHERHMQPFGTTAFGETRTWVCHDCHTTALVAATQPGPMLAVRASRH